MAAASRAGVTTEPACCAPAHRGSTAARKSVRRRIGKLSGCIRRARTSVPGKLSRDLSARGPALRTGDAGGALSVFRQQFRVERALPEVPVRILEITGIAAVEGVLRRLDHHRTGAF